MFPLRDGAGRSAGATPLRSTLKPIWLVLDLNPKKRGSQEQQLLALARRLGERGTPLAYFFSRLPPPWLAAQFAETAVRVDTLPFLNPLAAMAKWVAELARGRPGLVHFHFVRAGSPLVLAARVAGARVVLHDHLALHPLPRPLPVRIARSLRNRLVKPLVDARVPVSRYVAETVVAFERVDPARIEVLENAVDLLRFGEADGSHLRSQLQAGGRPIVVCVARLCREKGVETAVRALAGMRHDALLVLVGDGPLLGELRALSRELGVAERVRFAGLRNDVERFVAAADLSIVPSSGVEAFGQAVAESMAGGRAVVVTRSGALPDVVGDAGLVVPRDDPAALAAAIDRLLDDDALRARLGDAARARARARYGIDTWVDRMVALYDHVMAP